MEYCIGADENGCPYNSLVFSERWFCENCYFLIAKKADAVKWENWMDRVWERRVTEGYRCAHDDAR